MGEFAEVGRGRVRGLRGEDASLISRGFGD